MSNYNDRASGLYLLQVLLLGNFRAKILIVALATTHINRKIFHHPRPQVATMPIMRHPGERPRRLNIGIRCHRQQIIGESNGLHQTFPRLLECLPQSRLCRGITSETTAAPHSPHFL